MDSILQSQNSVIHNIDLQLILLVNGAGDENRTRMVFPPRDFKSLASACSATPADMVRLWGIEPQTP